MNRVSIEEVQRRVKTLADAGWPIRIDFKSCWRIQMGDTTSPTGLTATQLASWLDAFESGVRAGAARLLGEKTDV